MKLPGHSTPCLCAECRNHTGHPLISLQDLNFVRDGRTVLSDINMTIDRGDFVAITGPNGGGKTTLLRLILGLLKPTSGKIVYFDENGATIAAPPCPGYLPQKNSIDSHFPISVREVIASGLLGNTGLSKSEKAAKVEHTLELTHLTDLAARPIGRLSGGQLQRTLFGRAIVSAPQLLVLDEPLSYLDLNFEEKLYDIMEEISQRATVLLVSHQMDRLGAMANRHIIIDHSLRECTHAQHYHEPEC